MEKCKLLDPLLEEKKVYLLLPLEGKNIASKCLLENTHEGKQEKVLASSLCILIKLLIEIYLSQFPVDLPPISSKRALQYIYCGTFGSLDAMWVLTSH